MGPGAGFRAGWAAAGAPKTKIHTWHVTIPNSELREAVINSAPVMFETGRRGVSIHATKIHQSVVLKRRSHIFWHKPLFPILSSCD
ncbi:conserved hypothetical protein [Coccidioides posadasii str. Silveira]|uniref:Uncharacterized protein n=1 Tax=Coccidioides posadasii (strain RMSCC 757 / Silveira) TaxID=443226 RepID=E9CYE3_COCPS|nr:conserved hypothetical protein [Coccidioides posadasii str. Silveira]